MYFLYHLNTLKIPKDVCNLKTVFINLNTLFIYLNTEFINIKTAFININTTFCFFPRRNTFHYFLFQFSKVRGSEPLLNLLNIKFNQIHLTQNYKLKIKGMSVLVILFHLSEMWYFLQHICI